MKKNKLYIIILLACFMGYGWLFFVKSNSLNEGFTPCIIKSITTFPCPSCGTTRAVTVIFSGNFFQSLTINPFGIIVATIMIICPLWILYDVTLQNKTFYKFYTKTETFIKNRKIAIILTILVVLNWIWNIQKQL
jgi:hypothetical protein